MIMSLYQVFRKFKAEPITKYGFETDYACKDGVFIVTNTVSMIEDRRLKHFIKDMWDLYKEYSATDLSIAVFLPDTHCSLMRRHMGDDDRPVPLPNALIYQHFHQKVLDINERRKTKQQQAER